MAALVSVRNDGPDDAEVRYGPRRVLLKAGESLYLSTSIIQISAVPTLSPNELALHMGFPQGAGDPVVPPSPCRYAED